MIWVVDARKHYDKFKKNIEKLNHCETNKNYFYTEFDCYDEHENCFPTKWLISNAPVIFDFGIYDDITNKEHDKQKKWLWCVFSGKVQHCRNKIMCGSCFRKDTFIDRVLNFSNSYYTLPEVEKLIKEKEERIRKYQEEEQRREREYRKEKEELFKAKYPKEQKWREVIFNLKKDIINNELDPVILRISRAGKILGPDLYEYNDKRCMTLGIKSYPAEYDGKTYTKYDILMLVEYDDRIIPAITSIAGYVFSCAFDEDELTWNNYKYFIKTMDTRLNCYERFTIYFKDYDRVWTTKKLKEDLEFIDDKFSTYLSPPLN